MRALLLILAIAAGSGCANAGLHAPSSLNPVMLGPVKTFDHVADEFTAERARRTIQLETGDATSSFILPLPFLIGGGGSATNQRDTSNVRAWNQPGATLLDYGLMKITYGRVFDIVSIDSVSCESKHAVTLIVNRSTVQCSAEGELWVLPNREHPAFEETRLREGGRQ